MFSRSVVRITEEATEICEEERDCISATGIVVVSLGIVNNFCKDLTVSSNFWTRSFTRFSS
jgi:hypothetical protein